MKDQPTILKNAIRESLKPKAVLFWLALLYFCSIPYRYGYLCLYNWSGYWADATVMMIAAVALWLSKPWSYFMAALLTAPIIYNFAVLVLKIHNYIRMTPAEAEGIPWESVGEWWMIMLTKAPEQLGFIALAGVVFSYAAASLLRMFSHKRHALP